MLQQVERVDVVMGVWGVFHGPWGEAFSWEWGGGWAERVGLKFISSFWKFFYSNFTHIWGGNTGVQLLNLIGNQITNHLEVQFYHLLHLPGSDQVRLLINICLAEVNFLSSHSQLIEYLLFWMFLPYHLHKTTANWSLAVKDKLLHPFLARFFFFGWAMFLGKHSVDSYLYR